MPSVGTRASSACRATFAAPGGGSTARRRATGVGRFSSRGTSTAPAAAGSVLRAPLRMAGNPGRDQDAGGQDANVSRGVGAHDAQGVAPRRRLFAPRQATARARDVRRTVRLGDRALPRQRRGDGRPGLRPDGRGLPRPALLSAAEATLGYAAPGVGRRPRIASRRRDVLTGDAGDGTSVTTSRRRMGTDLARTPHTPVTGSPIA